MRLKNCCLERLYFCHYISITYVLHINYIYIIYINIIYKYLQYKDLTVKVPKQLYNKAKCKITTFYSMRKIKIIPKNPDSPIICNFTENQTYPQANKENNYFYNNNLSHLSTTLSTTLIHSIIDM